MRIAAKIKRFPRLYYSYMEAKMYLAEIKRLHKEAVVKFTEEKPKNGSLTNYRWALLRHVVSYAEYMHGYQFWNKNRRQQNEFVSEYEMRCIYRKTVQVSVGRLTLNKILILQHFKNYVSRKWIYPKEVSYELFETFLNTTDCVLKPIKGTFGEGIFLVKKGGGNDLKELYNFCCENKFFVEERVKECKEMESFHPMSLNTIRVFTLSGKDCCELIAAAFRMGVGDNIVDNGAAGGIFASIDTTTGKITGDGKNKFGNYYAKHPNSGKMIDGFAIPHWQKVVETCKEMASTLDGITFAGWDVCILENGNIELIELNTYPSVMIQAAKGEGLKSKIRAIGKQVLGYDPTKLISVWSKSHVNYERGYGMV